MTPKPKKCKSTGKAKSFEGCGTMSDRRKYGLCPNCYRTWLLTTEEGAEHIKKSTIQAKKRVEKENKAKKHRERKEFKNKHKSIAKLIQEARVYFQRYIRKRDQKKPCISCGNHYSEIFDAGHYYKAELYTGLIFDEDNVHKQCRKCNTFLHGNEAGYRIGLINRFGHDFVDILDKKAIAMRSYKYSREEILKIKEEYLKKSK
jgi:hypothetical protein